MASRFPPKVNEMLAEQWQQVLRCSRCRSASSPCRRTRRLSNVAIGHHSAESDSAPPCQPPTGKLWSWSDDFPPPKGSARAGSQELGGLKITLARIRCFSQGLTAASWAGYYAVSVLDFVSWTPSRARILVFFSDRIRQCCGYV